MSFNARQQFFFQPSTALLEPLNLRPKPIEELDNLAVLLTKRVEAYVCCHQPAHGRFILRVPCQQRSNALDHFVDPQLSSSERNG
jgi:hypothetical protein